MTRQNSKRKRGESSGKSPGSKKSKAISPLNANGNRFATLESLFLRKNAGMQDNVSTTFTSSQLSHSTDEKSPITDSESQKTVGQEESMFFGFNEDEKRISTEQGQIQSNGSLAKVHPFFTREFQKQKKNLMPSLRSEGTVKVNGQNLDTVVTSIHEIFMTPEQKKRKRELKNLQAFKDSIQKSKEFDTLFNKPSNGEHPLLTQRAKQKVGKQETIALFDCEPLTNVSQSKIWTHGPPVHVLQEDQMLLDASSNNYKWTNNFIDVNTHDNYLDDTLLYNSIEEEIEKVISHNPEHWWLRNNNQRKIKTIEPSSSNRILLSPAINFHVNMDEIMSQYLAFMSDKFKNATLLSVMNSQELTNLFKSLLYRRIPPNTKSLDFPSNSFRQWTDKYRPLSKEEIVSCNSESVEELWSWMKNWETFRESRKRRSKQRNSWSSSVNRSGNSLMDDEYDYEQSESESEGEFDPIANNLIMVSGDIGSGKTAAIYACAHELGFHVFEINSASVRSQSAVLKHIEATQSHQIKSFLSGKHNEQTGDGNEKLYSSSLLLFEEADNLFETDKNFFGGVKKIQKTTKRPLILASNDKFAIDDLTMCKQLEFTNVGLSLACTASFVQNCINKKANFIYLILLCEGVEVPIKGELVELITFFNGDIRKTLLNLQFWMEDMNRIPCYMGELIEQPLQTSLKFEKHLLEKCVGLDNLSENLFSMDDETQEESQYLLEDELAISRECNYDLMFNNYIDILNNNDNDLKNMSDIADYVDNLSQFDYSSDKYVEGKISYDISTTVYAAIEILNHKNFIHKYSHTNPKPSVTKLNALAPAFSMTSQTKVSNPLYASYTHKKKEELVELVRKAVSPAMSLFSAQHELIHVILSICATEEEKKERKASRRFYHHLQDIYQTEDLAKLSNVARRTWK